MIQTWRRAASDYHLERWLIVLAALVAAVLLGMEARRSWLFFIVAAGMGLLFLRRPILGLVAAIVLALLIPLAVSTGTQVPLNLAALLLPLTLAIWLAGSMLSRQVSIVWSRSYLPLLLLTAAMFISLLIGSLNWDPFVPRTRNFFLVQMAQIALFALSFIAFFLMANVVRDKDWLSRLTWLFLLLGGILALLFVLPVTAPFVRRFATVAVTRAPFWVLLAGLAGGQLLFNRALSPGRRLYLLAVLGLVLYSALVVQRNASSIWVGVASVLAVLFWFRFPRLRWLVLLVVVLLTSAGILFPALYDFAGGEDAWIRTGGSRLVLIERVLEDTQRNPITGLGPAAYRLYGATRPLRYVQAFWRSPSISSHNNYVDIYSHAGIIGLLLFFWFAGEIAALGARLKRRTWSGFADGYLHGMLAAGAGSLVIMALADWILPFVYNIGFPGFQASVLVWLYLGGLVALEKLPTDRPQPAALAE